MTDPTLKLMLAKLATPHWTPMPTHRYVVVRKPEDVGTFNLFWVMQGKFAILPKGFFEANMAAWFSAVALANKIADGCPVHESAVTLSCSEFYTQILTKNPAVFRTVYPIHVWEKMFNAKEKQVRNVRTG